VTDFQLVSKRRSTIYHRARSAIRSQCASNPDQGSSRLSSGEHRPHCLGKTRRRVRLLNESGKPLAREVPNGFDLVVAAGQNNLDIRPDDARLVDAVLGGDKPILKLLDQATADESASDWNSGSGRVCSWWTPRVSGNPAMAEGPGPSVFRADLHFRRANPSDAGLGSYAEW
jgi:hypothetical protein